jgi:hypothetical protein
MKIPVAKAKRRAADREADAEALAAYEKSVAENIVRGPAQKKPRREVSTGEVVQIMADEIEALYKEMGARIDRVNAEDKALILWRNVAIYHEAVAVEKKIPHSLCEEHRG